MSEKRRSVRCLGIDPGLANCGWAVVSRMPRGQFRVLDHGCLRTASRDADGSRYLAIYQKISELLSVHHPHGVAIERVFFGKNVSSALTTGGTIAICELAAAEIGIQTLRVTPQQAKPVTGSGRAEKQHVQRMVKRFTGAEIQNAHAADAVAVAMAGLLATRVRVASGKTAHRRGQYLGV